MRPGSAPRLFVELPVRAARLVAFDLDAGVIPGVRLDEALASLAEAHALALHDAEGDAGTFLEVQRVAPVGGSLLLLDGAPAPLVRNDLLPLLGPTPRQSQHRQCQHPNQEPRGHAVAPFEGHHPSCRIVSPPERHTLRKRYVSCEVAKCGATGAWGHGFADLRPGRRRHTNAAAMERSLRNRLTFGPVMLAGLFLLLWLDYKAQQWTVGAYVHRGEQRGVAGIGI